MSDISVVAIAVIALLFLLAIGCTVPLSLAGSGALGILLLRDFEQVTITMGVIPYESTAHYSLVVVPLFILMGMFAMNGRLAEDIFAVAAKVFRRVPGGLGIATVMASAGFAAVSGSSLATAATIGKMSIGEMQRYGYRSSFAAGIVAASGTLGVLIPPSIFLVFYGIVANESIGAMLLAGILPGIVTVVVYSVSIALRYQIAARSGSTAVMDGPGSDGGLREFKMRDGLRASAIIGIVFLVVIGGIYSGIFTVTESAAIGALAVALLAPVHLILRGNRKDIGLKIWNAAKESASLTSMLFAILVGASIFTFFLVSAGVPTLIAQAVGEATVPNLAVVGLFLLVCVPLGMFLDPLSMLLIIVPIAHPIVTDLGFSGIWFGILIVKMIELAMITPPVGLNVYVIAGVTGLDVEDVFHGVSWFFGIETVVILVLLFIPSITLILPGLMKV